MFMFQASNCSGTKKNWNDFRGRCWGWEGEGFYGNMFLLLFLSKRRSKTMNDDKIVFKDKRDLKIRTFTSLLWLWFSNAQFFMNFFELVRLSFAPFVAANFFYSILNFWGQTFISRIWKSSFISQLCVAIFQVQNVQLQINSLITVRTLFLLSGECFVSIWNKKVSCSSNLFGLPLFWVQEWEFCRTLSPFD